MTVLVEVVESSDDSNGVVVFESAGGGVVEEESVVFDYSDIDSGTSEPISLLSGVTT